MRRDDLVGSTMSGVTIPLAVPLAVALFAMPIMGQAGDVRQLASASATAEAFRLGALRASQRYRTTAQATLDGYRSVGPDFPGMGVHWLHIPNLIDGEMDPERPDLLCYIEIDGSLTLVNVAHGVALLAGQEPPPVSWLPPDPWHEHHGTIEEEMLRPHGHDGNDRGGAEESGARVVIFHMWTTPNPAGSFNQHNWALPFLRAGLSVPDEPSEFGARFVGLGTESGLGYQLEIVELLFPDNVLDEARSQIHDAAEAAAQWITTVRGREDLDSRELTRLDESWRALGARLLVLAPDEQVSTTIARLHGL